MLSTSSSDGSSILTLVVRTSSVGIYYGTAAGHTGIEPSQQVDTLMTPHHPPPATNAHDDYMTLLHGTLDEFNHYARQERAKWLIDIAHDICDPRHMRGTLEVMASESQPPQWTPVYPGDPLVGSVYRYVVPPSVTSIAFTKTSARNNKSLTAEDGTTTSMRTAVHARDERCWVSSTVYPVANSHILPKRMGDHLAAHILDVFCGLAPGISVHVSNAIFGFLLSLNLNLYFAHYHLGFRARPNGQYEVHSFVNETPGCTVTIFGKLPSTSDLGTSPPLHGHTASPPFPGRPHIPPPGLFRWHYLQCVLAQFGYRAAPNNDIEYEQLPLPMDGDSGSDGGDTDSDADWPSAALDWGRLLQETHVRDIERRKAVVEWITARPGRYADPHAEGDEHPED
ncbi:hypothetical protein DFH06DRAFT_267634 [Mycena polygramma]|nr:hypothetical protein DFH06DRAFT_267634 [Mycena polygramma]